MLSSPCARSLTAVPNRKASLQCPPPSIPAVAQPPSVPAVPNRKVSLQCPTTKYPCLTTKYPCSASPPSIPAVPSHQVSLQCPTTKCPCSAQPQSIQAVPDHKVSLQCLATKYSCSAQPPSVPAVPNHQVSAQCPRAEYPKSSKKHYVLVQFRMGMLEVEKKCFSCFPTLTVGLLDFKKSMLSSPSVQFLTSEYPAAPNRRVSQQSPRHPISSLQLLERDAM